MWYRFAVEYNAFGQIIKGNPKTKNFFTRQFAEEDEDPDTALEPLGEDDPLVNIDQPELPEEPEFTPVPTNVPPSTDTPAGVNNREPIKAILPPNIKVPPLHEFCHCEIITMPSGQQVWRLGNGENHCAECVNSRNIFNAANENAYKNI
jgi:hypothetical protein